MHIQIHSFDHKFFNDIGVLVTKPISPFRYFPNISALCIHTLEIEYHVYIWLVSPQLSYDDTGLIWICLKESNGCFCKIDIYSDGEINERSFITPHPRIMKRHQTGTFSALLVPGEFSSRRPVTRSIDVYLDLRLNTRLSKHSRRRWLDTSWRSLSRHCNDKKYNTSRCNRWCDKFCYGLVVSYNNLISVGHNESMLC